MDSVGYDFIDGVMYFADSEEDENFIEYHFNELINFRKNAIKSTRKISLSLLEDANFGIDLFFD